jgi:hypothetical protein
MLGRTGACVLYSIVNSPVDGTISQFRDLMLNILLRLTLALGHSSQLTRISKHVVQRDLGGQSELVVSDLGVDNGTTPLIESSNNGTCKHARGGI